MQPFKDFPQGLRRLPPIAGGSSAVNAWLSEVYGVVPVFEPKDWTAGADGDSFDISKAARASIIFMFGAMTGNPVLTIYGGATAGTKTTAMTFSYRQSSGDYKAASADLWGAAATSAALTLTGTTYDHTMLLVDIPAAVSLDGKHWITAEIGAVTANFMAAVALLVGPRYAPPLTAI